MKKEKDIIKTYLSIITQQPQNTEQQQQQVKQQPMTQAELKFTAELATEFSNTVNKFTIVCNKAIQRKMVDKETSDKLYNYLSKIKNLLDAAAKTQ